AASASSVGTGATARRRARARPLAVPTPMRSPVNEPGPIETARPSRSDGRHPASASSRSTATRTRSECVTRMLSVDSPTTRSPSTSAAPPASVDVSSARTFTVPASVTPFRSLTRLARHGTHQGHVGERSPAEDTAPSRVRRRARARPPGRRRGRARTRVRVEVPAPRAPMVIRATGPVEAPPPVRAAPPRPPAPPLSLDGTAAVLRAVRPESSAQGARLALDVDGAAAVTTQTLERPARIIVDLQDTRVEPTTRTIPVGRGLLRQVRISQHTATAVRVVCELAHPTRFRVEPTPEGLILHLGEGVR